MPPIHCTTVSHSPRNRYAPPTPIDAVIWCTGFRPALDHLALLGIVEADGQIAVNGTRALREPRLWLVGYGEWTGFASATILGVGRTAPAMVAEIDAFLQAAHDDA